MSENTATPASVERPKPPLSNGVKAAIMLLVTMGLILVAGIIFVAVVVMKRASQPAATEPRVGIGGRFGGRDNPFPPRGRGKSLLMGGGQGSLSTGAIAIHTVTTKQGAAAQEEIIIVSTRTGVELGRIRLRPLSDFAENQGR